MKPLRDQDGAIIVIELVVLALVLSAAAFAVYQYASHKKSAHNAIKPQPHTTTKTSSSPSPAGTSPTPSHSPGPNPTPTSTPPIIDGHQCKETLQINASANTATCSIKLATASPFGLSKLLYLSGRNSGVKSDDLAVGVQCGTGKGTSCVAKWFTKDSCTFNEPTCTQYEASQTLAASGSSTIIVPNSWWMIDSITKLTLIMPYVQKAQLPDGSKGNFKMDFDGQPGSSYEDWSQGNPGAGYPQNTYYLNLIYVQE